MRELKFLAHLQEMSDSEIKRIIPPYVLDDIKRKDPKPVFRAYVVGQEGEAEARAIGIGKIVKNWFSSAINRLVEKLHYGLKIFHNHADTNEHIGRIEIGEVVGSKAGIVENKLSAIAAMYIYPEFRNIPLDVASIEADVNIDTSMHDGIEAVDVLDVTGIALGNSAVNKPGFAGATLLGELQAFADQSQFHTGGGTMPTINEIRDFVDKEGINPSDIFGREKLTDDPVVKGYVEAERKEASAGEYAHRKRTDSKFDEERKKWEESEKKYQEEITGLKLGVAKIKAVDVFGKKLKERKLDDKQMKFIDSRREGFEPKNTEKLEEEVDLFLDNSLEEYKKTAEIFGIETKTQPLKKAGSEPSEGASEDASHIPD